MDSILEFLSNRYHSPPALIGVYKTNRYHSPPALIGVYKTNRYHSPPALIGVYKTKVASWIKERGIVQVFSNVIWSIHNGTLYILLHYIMYISLFLSKNDHFLLLTS